jgi:hypothetical protein
MISEISYHNKDVMHFFSKQPIKQNKTKQFIHYQVPTETYLKVTGKKIFIKNKDFKQT